MLSAEALWNLNDIELKSLLESGKLKPCSDTVRFYAPSFSHYRNKHLQNTPDQFSSISITGNTCALNCRHCGGKVLETMYSALSPKELYELGQNLKAKGAKGVLVSGGCLADGSVPLDKFIAVLAQFKRELGLTVFVHTGIVSKQTAEALKAAEVDAVLIDVIGSQHTIQNTLNLNITTHDYAASLQTLSAAGLNVVPHVIVGLNNGKLDGELQALKIIHENSHPAAIVIIALMPIHGTQMAKISPPKPIDIAKTVAAVRVTFPNTPLLLGCMRPKGNPRAETDILALKAGVDGLAFPAQEAIEYAKTKGFKVEFSAFCCAQMYRDCRM